MDDYKPNSYKAKAESKESEKKVEKVVTGKVTTKKKSEAHKFKDLFVSEDASNVKNYILLDVLVPAIKKAVKDIVTDGIEMILYGEKGRRSSSNSSSSSFISYDRFSSNDRNYTRANVSSRYDYDDIIFDNRGDAEDVLTKLEELIATYRVASVADLYDLVGKSCNYTDNKYGWTNVRSADVIRVHDGWMLKLPKALPL